MKKRNREKQEKKRKRDIRLKKREKLNDKKKIIHLRNSSAS